MSEAVAAQDDRSHDPANVARALAEKLASRARHVCVLLGAGASCASGLPTLAQLEEIVLHSFSDPDKAQLEELLEGRNLESALSRLRRIDGLLENDESFEGLTSQSAQELDEAICNAIKEAVDASESDIGPFKSFASWAARMETQTPIEIFTVNYDLLVERGLEALSVPYFDGFVGGVSAPFMPELVDPSNTSNRSIPSGFVRVWKLHGSTNWRSVNQNGTRMTVRVADNQSKGASAIYPSDEKYDEARRVPFVVLMDRFRSALIEPETITIASGYSFGDDHLNEMIFDAARRHPRSEVVALCYSDIPELLAKEAATTRNLVVLSPKEAVIGGRRAPWQSDSAIAGVFEGDSFLLGDFQQLATFLSSQVVPADE